MRLCHLICFLIYFNVCFSDDCLPEEVGKVPCVAPDFVHLPILSKLNKSGWGSYLFVHMLKWTKTVDHVDMKFITNRFCPFSNLCEGSGSNLHTIQVRMFIGRK